MGKHRRLFRLRFGRGAELRRELDDEIRTHIELRVEELTAKGWDPSEARREAERRFGDLSAAKEALYMSARRRERRLDLAQMADELRRDVVLAARRSLRTPAYSAVSVTVMAIGIALTTSMFAVVDHVLLRPLPYPEPDRLVALQSVGESGDAFNQVSMENWVDWRERETTLSATAIHAAGRVTVDVGGGDPFRITGAWVAGDFFDVLRPAMASGRGFSSEEGQRGEPVLVVSEPFAVQHFGTVDAALGALVEVNARQREVVGVLGEGQALPEDASIWWPIAYRPGSGATRNNVNYLAIARLDDGTELPRAEADLSATARSIMEADPEAVYSYGVGVAPLRDVVVGDSAEFLWMLMAAVGVVLLAACANLAGLGLARARSRGPETAVRLALGSGRARLLRQMLTEHVLLALVGGALGVLATWLAGTALLAVVGSTVPRAGGITLDYRVAFFAFSISLIAGVAAGLVPALRSSELAPGVSRARGTAAGGRGLPGSALVTTEIALALALVIGGGLLLRSFQSVTSRDLGFQPQGVLTAEIALTGTRYREPAAAVRFWSTLLEDLDASPAVEAAAAGNWIPTGGSGTSFLEFPDNPSPDFGGGYRVVSDAYFETLRIPVLAGRTFDRSDVEGSTRVTLVNAALAERAWPGQSPIGRRVRPVSMEAWMYDQNPPWLEVIGVVGDVRHYGHEADPEPELFVSFRQVPMWTQSMTAVVRPAAGGADALDAIVRERAHALDPSLAVDVSPLDLRVRARLDERRLTVGILSTFAATALLLMCLGIYGLVAYAATQRTKEMAIRAALGARRSGLLGLMLGHAARIIVLGVIVGSVAGYGLTNLMRSLLVDTAAVDPLTYLASGTILTVVGLVAALVPSARAARMDPIEALNAE